MGAEVGFEYLLGKLEGTRGTAEATPTEYLPLVGMVKPNAPLWYPDEARGTLARNYRALNLKSWATWSASGALDTHFMPFWLEMAVKGGVTPTTPYSGVYLWTHAPTLNADNLKTATLYWGDPGVQALRAPFCFCEELTISGNATANEGVQVNVSGQGATVTKTAPLSVPSLTTGGLLPPADMQLWIDTATIGTTEILGRVISAEAKIRTEARPKYVATGTSGTRTFSQLGRAKRSARLSLVLELADMTQYDQWMAATTLKARVRWNGALIATTYRHYVEFDIYGPFMDADWSTLEESNRTIRLDIESVVDSVAGYDYAVKVQNARATL